MKTLHLHGALAKQFGSEFQLAVSGPAEAIRLMEANFPGQFVKAIVNKWFRVRVGKKTQELRDISECEVLMQSADDEIHIEPVVAGGIKGLFGLFFGVPLLGSIFAPLGLPFGGAFGAAGGAFGFGAGGALGGFGSIALGLALLGVIYLISSAIAPDEPAKDEDKDAKPSFLFNGPVNVQEQGVAVPLVYGRIRTGSVVVAGGISVEDQVLEG